MTLHFRCRVPFYNASQRCFTEFRRGEWDHWSPLNSCYLHETTFIQLLLCDVVHCFTKGWRTITLKGCNSQRGCHIHKHDRFLGKKVQIKHSPHHCISSSLHSWHNACVPTKADHSLLCNLFHLSSSSSCPAAMKHVRSYCSKDLHIYKCPKSRPQLADGKITDLKHFCMGIV